jgi:hypothetical protein
VLYACVKVLLPLACALLLGCAIWHWLIPERPLYPWRDYNPWNFADWARNGFGPTLVTQLVLTIIGVAGFTAVVGWVGYAAVTGRGIKQRLTDPAPIDEAPESLATT